MRIDRAKEEPVRMQAFFQHLFVMSLVVKAIHQNIQLELRHRTAQLRKPLLDVGVHQSRKIMVVPDFAAFIRQPRQMPDSAGAAALARELKALLTVAAEPASCSRRGR